jgi:hypothetical protein
MWVSSTKSKATIKQLWRSKKNDERTLIKTEIKKERVGKLKQ